MRNKVYFNSSAHLSNIGKRQRRYGALLERYEVVKSGLARISDQRQERGVKREVILRFLNELRQQDAIIETFDEDLWNITMETATVDCAGDITFTFKNGTQIKIQQEDGKSIKRD